MRKRGKYCLLCGEPFKKPRMGKKFCNKTCRSLSRYYREKKEKKQAKSTIKGNTIAKTGVLAKKLPDEITKEQVLQWLKDNPSKKIN